MEKILKPKENYTPEKLCKEIKAKGIENRMWDLEASYELEWEEGAEAVVQSVLDAHDPTPEPKPLTLEEQVEVLDGAMNELLFEILPSLQGGEI